MRASNNRRHIRYCADTNLYNLIINDSKASYQIYIDTKATRVAYCFVVGIKNPSMSPRVWDQMALVKSPNLY